MNSLLYIMKAYHIYLSDFYSLVIACIMDVVTTKVTRLDATVALVMPQMNTTGHLEKVLTYGFSSTGCINYEVSCFINM